MSNAIINTDNRQGEIIGFGTYPQSGNPDVKTDIEWIVLNTKGRRILVISRYLLDCEPYDLNSGFA